jgi:hypothetical protein
MKAKFYLFLILIVSVSFLLNCKEKEPTPTPPVIKKYYISTVKKNGLMVEKYTYNADNRLIKWQTNDSTGALYCDFTYDSNGVLTDLNLNYSSLPIGYVNVEMNSSNNPAKAIINTISDTTTIIFDYTGTGNLTQLNYYLGLNVVPDKKIGFLEIVYDVNKNISREIYYDSPNILISQNDYVYDLKNSPLYYNEIKWPYYLLMQYFSGKNVSHFLSKNNMVKDTKTSPAPVKVTTSNYIYNTDGYPNQMTEGTDVYNIVYIVK